MFFFVNNDTYCSSTEFTFSNYYFLNNRFTRFCSLVRALNPILSCRWLPYSTSLQGSTHQISFH